MSAAFPQPVSDQPVAIVTGGSRGIGRAIALRLANDGYDVVIAYKENGAAAEEAVAAISGMGRTCLAVKANVCNAEEVRGLFRATQDKFGRLDALINNAGVLYEGLLQMTSEMRLREVFDSNMFAPFNCMKAAIPEMLRRRSGTIINISSTASRGVPGLSAYGASKAALDALTRSVAKEVARYGIRVLAVAPSWTQTDMVDSSQKAKTLATAKSAMGRPATVDEVAALVAAVLKADLTYLSGQVIGIDGGGVL
jgi:3-oxoacyl-[acyl-carrier protein] reductase